MRYDDLVYIFAEGLYDPKMDDVNVSGHCTCVADSDMLCWE